MKTLNCRVLTLAVATSLFSQAAFATVATAPFKRVVIEVGYRHNGSSQRTQLLIADRVGDRIKLSQCVGGIYGYSDCRPFGSAYGYDAEELSQIFQKLKGRSLAYRLLVATPTGVCGSILGGVAAGAAVVATSMGLVELGAAIGSFEVALIALAPLFFSPFIAMGGALAGAAMTVDKLETLYAAEIRTVGPKNSIDAMLNTRERLAESRLHGSLFGDGEPIGYAHVRTSKPTEVLNNLENKIWEAGGRAPRGSLGRE